MRQFMYASTKSAVDKHVRSDLELSGAEHIPTLGRSPRRLLPLRDQGRENRETTTIRGEKGSGYKANNKNNNNNYLGFLRAIDSHYN